MSDSRLKILVYGDWIGMEKPIPMGELYVQQNRGNEVFSFSYSQEWLESKYSQVLDPNLRLHTGEQYTNNDSPTFGMFLDSMPDRWGRELMRKRITLKAKEQDERPPKLQTSDFLLGVSDTARMGGIRFKLEEDGPFLDNSSDRAIPPISEIRELQHSAQKIETSDDFNEIRKWLTNILAPGSSLGGARPKASVVEENGEIWIAKFPSNNDEFNIGGWEYIVWQLAKEAKVNVPPAQVDRIADHSDHTFFTQRFDREEGGRVHFASAMTMTGNFEGGEDKGQSSYLDLAEFLQTNGASTTQDLHQLWRRIVFNILVSNTDDHLRNHGFLLTERGWRLSPAYDMNPSLKKRGLSLNIDQERNELDLTIPLSVGEYFRLGPQEMDNVINEVEEAVSKWEDKAKELGLSRMEIEEMRAAFLV